ncbi:MAG: PAS domain S-box protein [Chitinophagaceae bacterium]|nr:MAG: PAS domain S-box protein [Chitinophagaceae bacterium]
MEELRKAYLKYKQITDAVPQIIWENDTTGRAFFFNKRWFEYSGVAQEEAEGRGWVVIVHPDDVHAVDAWRRSLEHIEPFEANARLRRHDGQYLWHLLRNIPIKDSAGALIGWFGTATSIENQKRTESLLKERSTLLHTILETARDFAIVTLDASGHVVDWNSGAEKLFGYNKEEVLGRYADFLFTEEDRSGGVPEAEMRIANETGQSLDERWHIRKDGTRFFMSGVLTSMISGPIKGFVKITRDITDRKLAEEALLLSEQKKTLAIQSGQMGEWSFHVPDSLFEGNEQCSRILSLEPIKRKLSLDEGARFIHPEDRAAVMENLATALRGLNIFHSECRVLAGPDEKYRWISCYGRVVAHEDNQPIKMIGVMYDITERVMLEKQKDDFISIASHELRSPVTSIKAYTELLQENFGDAGGQSAELARKLAVQVDRLVKLIYNLLDYSNLAELRMRLFPERFDINELISEALNQYQSNASGHHIIWRPATVAEIHADRDRIRQVLDNLISNAIKNSPEGSDIIIATRDLLDGVEVSVQDFGVGIPVEAQPHVFERYFRVTSGMQQYNRGLGLGLYISSEIIRHHTGTIRLESIPGKGSTFFFTLPYS